MSIIAKKIPYPVGELVGLVKSDEDDFHVFIPSNDDNIIMFVMKDKKAMDTLAGKLQQMITYIKQHNEKCDCQ